MHQFSVKATVRHTSFYILITNFDIGYKFLWGIKGTLTCLQNAYQHYIIRQLYKYAGVRCSLVVTFAAIRLQGPRFKPRPGQKC